MTERPTRWLEVEVELPAAFAEIAAAAVGEITDGVEFRDAGTMIRAAPGRVVVVAHVVPSERERLLAVIDACAEQSREAGLPTDPIVIRERHAHEDEWRDVWKQFFRATRVGRSFIVRPSWDPGTIASGDRVIDLDPGRAFGTGGHASTRLVIALAEDLAETASGRTRPVRRFLDLGCGSGILAIAAARLWPEATGLAVDVDPEATACTRENLDRNQITSVTVATGSLDVVPPEATIDVVLANIQADVLIQLAPELPARTGPGAAVIVSGLLLDDAAPVLAAFQTAGFELVQRRDEGEWAALALARI